jgi:hypothetical protein
MVTIPVKKLIIDCKIIINYVAYAIFEKDSNINYDYL